MQENYQYLQSFLDVLEDHTILLDETGTVLCSNGTHSSFEDRRKNSNITEEIGTNYFDALKKLNKSVEIQAFQKVLEGDIKEFSFHFSLPSEAALSWYHLKAKRFTISENTHGLVITTRDITEQYVLKMNVDDVLESMSDAFYSLDDQWNFTHINTAASELLDREPGFLIGKNVWLEFPDTIGSDFYHYYLKTVETQKSQTFEAYYAPLNRWFELHVYPQREEGISVYFKNISDRKKSESDLKQFAYFDDLTSLPNRRWMIERIDEAIKKDTESSILYLDIDGFKNINDLYGHIKGDILLKKVARKLYKAVSSHGHIGRIGGDEFLIFVREKSRFELEVLAREIAAIFSKPIVIDDHLSFSISISIGISRYPGDSQNVTELLSYADTSMYRAKKMRGNQYQFYHANMTSELSRRVNIEDSLSDDLQKNGVYFQYQPQIDYVTGELKGFEVLSRWNHPVLGAISPLEFIEIAEESGNILKLTYYLMAEVFSVVTSWRKKFGYNLTIAINVTPYLISQRSFFDDFFELLERYNLPAEMIELEITEDSQIEASETTLANMKNCQERGVRIAIDDFGTGYSLFKSLTHFPVNKIKIDRYFVNRIGHDAQSEAIIRSFVDFADNLNCELVAEGVETKEEAEFLTSIGCTVFQGYYLEKPMDIGAFESKYIAINIAGKE